MYENDEFTRLMPGIKDYVSVSKNVHKQKRLILCNLKELYATFCEKYPELKIRFSKFCSLRPKWCVPVSSKGSHSVCVCIQHQNAILLVDAANNNETYKTLIDKIVFSTVNKMCMLHRCEQCPGSPALEGFLLAQYDEELDDEVQCQQWKSTDTMDLITVLMMRYEWIQEIVRVLDDLTKHSFIAKCQSRYLNSRKSSVTDDTCVILLDFAENYTFTIQDEVQSYHWNQQQCTIHPAVVYYMQDHILMQQSFCFVSDDLTHDTAFVHGLLYKLTALIPSLSSTITKVEYFSDGCAGQYKNMLNLCHHKCDFNLEACWSFFATSHGKSPCDGVGGTVKRLVKTASLLRPTSDQM
ncbi:uncharacterized protein LOC143466202 [Clavelina lepadiformis]|uniref:uncharacterized protein LOC143466202 n=1 Tax=Clavelina lepadiformis TaxID=159417 RepID=UPI004042F1BC